MPLLNTGILADECAVMSMDGRYIENAGAIFL